MRHNYFNLNQNASKDDGQVPRNVQMSSTCPQPDSVSNPCRCRVFATPRVFSADFSARAWKHVAMIFAVLVMSIANVGVAWADTELANINFKSWTPQSISAGSTVNGCYFRSAVTITAANGATFGGNATTSSNWVAIPLSGINGSITITLTHASSRPQWKNYFKGLNAAPSSSDLSSNPSSVGDNTRPGSNTTTSSWTINTDKLYGVFYVGKGSNGLNDIYSITITTPDWTYYYRGADNSWGADAMTKSSEGFYSYKSSSTNDHQFKIAKSTSSWDYNYSFVDAGYLGTSITTISSGDNNNCHISSAPASYYIIVFRPGSAMNTTANPKICASATLPAEKFTISFNNGGGSGSMSSISNVVYGSEKATTANTFTKSGYRFTGWHANVDVKVGGATKTAGTLLDDEVTIQEIKSDITLTAQWEVDDGCNKIFWFANSADATTNGVTNNTTTFSGVDAGTSGVSGSITIDGKTYTATGRGSNNSNAITFTVPANKVGTLYGLANSSGSSARTLTLTNTDSYSETQSTSASSSTAGAFTFEDMPAGSYSLAWSGNGAENMLCLKLCDAPAGCDATQPGALSKGTLSGCSRTITASGSAATNNTWYWQSSASGTDKSDAYSSGKAITEAGTYYLRSFCSDGAGCWSDAVQVTITAADMTPAAPTALAAASPTAKGVTLTVTDAANTNDYEFYVNTSSSAPGGSTPATHSSNTKSITITNLYAGTTFYAWARAKCGSNKSDWVALGDGGTFTTSKVTMTPTLTNITHTSGATSNIGGSDYTAVFTANTNYSMPNPTVTIDGTPATIVTDYTWSVEGAVGTITIPANKINGNIVITLNSAAAAPSSVAITGDWLYFAGETIELTATPTGGNGPVTYQWYKGGKENGNAIEGATSATYTKASCAYEDAGSYYCKVTCGGSASTWGQNGDAYDVKIPRLYVKTGHNYDLVKPDYGNVDFTRATASTATASITLGSNWDYCYNIADGCGHYYGNAGTMQYNNYGPWTTNVNNQDCGLRTTNGATYVFTINYSNWTELKTTVTFPVGNQAADKVIYFDNNDRNWSTLHYRIGRTDHTQATAMTQVPGTANLYKVTTTAYNNFSGWQIGNAAGDNGSGKSIYNTQNAPAITASTAHEGGAVTESAVTVTPTTSRGNGSDVGINDNCEFYNYTITNGMKTQNVSITAPSNGTLTVNYVDVNGDGQAFNSGNRDLAHTCIITVTAVPSTGYAEPATVSINGASHGNRDPYTITGTTVVAATFTAKTYNITLDRNGASSGSESVTMTYNSSSHTAITAPVKAGYTFDGWYDSETDNNGSGNLVMNASGVLQENVTGYTGAGGIWTKDATCTLYAKWTAAASLTAIECNTLYKVEDMVASSITSITGSEQYAAGLSSNTKFEVLGTGSSNATGGPMGAKTESATISEVSFTNALYFKGTGNKSGEIPTSRGIKFITPSAGTLDIYVKGPGSINIVKEGGTGSAIGAGDSNAKVSVEVTAGTYYLYATASSRTLFGIKLNCCSDPVINEGSTKTSFAGGSWPQNSGHTITITATGADSYEWYRNTAATDAGATKLSETSNTLDITAGVAAGTYFYKAIAKSGACSSSTEWGWCGAMSITAVTYSITYDCDGAESGCPSNVAAATNLPNPLPSAPTKDGYDFVGWYTNSTKTVAAVAGAALSENTTLYAKWTEHVTSECITITDFETSNHNKSDNKPDSEGKYFYGYKGTKDAAHAVTITATNGDCIGVNSGAELKVYAGKYVNIYADNTTTGGTPATFSNVTSVSIDAKMINSSYYTTFDIKVGETTIADDVSLVDAKSSYQTFTYDGLAQLSGKIKIINNGSGSSYNFYADNIQICTADMDACTTPTIPDLSNQSLCSGAAAAAWNATVSNAATIEAAGESVAYKWQKKNGSNWDDISGATTATYDVDGSGTVTEAMEGTFRVVVTVSKAGKSSTTANKEVTLSVTEATEVTAITADKATVYPGNSVTLTATANTSATWQWYTCTNAEGDGAVIISGAESASYTITSAGAGVAGTYYYKAVATGSCGTAERVYTLTVTAASECQNYYWFIYADDATANGVVNNRDGFFSNTTTGTGNTGTYTMTVDGTSMTGTKRLSTGAYKPKFTVPAGATATLYIYGKAASSDAGKHLVLKRTSDDEEVEVTSNTTVQAYTKEDIEPGEWTLSCGSSNWCYSFFAVKVCSASSCTDATPTIAAVNNTVCSGTKMRIDATGYETGATFKWQKLNTSTSSWDDVAGATLDSLVIASVTVSNAGSYRFIATKGCARTSNTVTISVPSAPVFGDVPSSVTVMQTIALSITTVEASDAVKYRWYKSADPTWDAGDVEIGTNKELIKAYDSEAIGSPSYYIFCRAQNACGITTSSAIAVNVTAYVEEDCATRGNEGEAHFGFENTGMSSGTYDSKNVWYKNSNSNYLTYTAPEGKYLATAKVTVASSNSSNASYQYSTDNGANWSSGVTISGLTTSLAEKTINLPANVTDFRIGRNLDGAGESSGTFYLHKACFEYTDACTATTVTPSTASTSYEMGGAWSNPTFTLSVAGTLTYSSSNEDIASVDDDGTVTFNGEAGTVTITASYAGGTISETEYCASSGSYTITVSCSGGAPKVVASGASVDCNSSITLLAKTQSDGDFADGTYQWFRNGEEIDGATSSSYTATQAGTYTVERTNASDCTTPSTNSAVVTSETTEPEVERLVPFQYYHVDKDYSNQMKMRHLFAVKNSGTLDGKHFKMYVSRNGAAATDVTSSNALVVVPNGDGHVDTVKVDLNKLRGKYDKGDELVYTCKAIDCESHVSETYKSTIQMHVIDTDTATLALICSGTSKAGGTRKTGELTVGGDFLTGYNVADLCQQTGNTSFDGNTEWGLYTDLKTQYIVTPVNGYAVFNKLNYEPFDILLLTDYPKASKSDAAADVLDDMAALCDYRPMLSFKTHMVAKSPSKWAEKGFTTSPVVTKADGRLNLNIVCYAHPMFEGLKSGDDVYTDVGNTSAPLVYTMLTGTGFESSKGMQGFELAAAENFITIGLTHYNGTITKDSPDPGEVEWTPGSEDRMLVTVAERQANPEARFILFSLNCGAQSKLTDKGEEVVLACLNYLLGTAEGTIEPADCSFTFDNGENNEHNAAWYTSNCPLCTGTKGDGLWTTAANWGPDYRLLPGEFTSVRIKKPVEVNDEHAHVMEVRIIDGGSVDIPAGKALDVKSTIRRMDGSEIYPTEISDIHIGSASTGNGTLIFNNDEGDTKARVDMYSKGFIDHTDPANEPKGVKNYQYMGTPFIEVNALYNYYGSWIYYWKADGSGWKAVKNGGPMTAWTGYCITQEEPTYHQMSGTLTATGTVDINVPADANMVVGNSWTAPIDINALTTDDLEGLTASIYFFNTGVDKKGEGTTTENATGDARWAGGTYVSVPIHSAPYTGDDHIPSLQGFFVKNTNLSAEGTLHLDYERHVRKTTRDNILSGQMHAPARRTALSSDEPVVLKMKVSGENYDDKLLLLEREDFSEGFDNGWDGDKWDGNESALYIYTTDSEGTENSVSAIPELEGTIIGFRAGEDDAYTLNFEYLNSDEPLYLYDVENNTYTQIMTGMTYRFFTTDNEKHERFIITRSNGQEVATGVGEVPSDQVQGTKAKKLLIENKMFIMVNGMLYDATGKVVK